MDDETNAASVSRTHELLDSQNARHTKEVAKLRETMIAKQSQRPDSVPSGLSDVTSDVTSDVSVISTGKRKKLYVFETEEQKQAKRPRQSGATRANTSVGPRASTLPISDQMFAQLSRVSRHGPASYASSTWPPDRQPGNTRLKPDEQSPVAGVSAAATLPDGWVGRWLDANTPKSVATGAVEGQGMPNFSGDFQHSRPRERVPGQQHPKDGDSASSGRLDSISTDSAASVLPIPETRTANETGYETNAQNGNAQPAWSEPPGQTAMNPGQADQGTVDDPWQLTNASGMDDTARLLEAILSENSNLGEAERIDLQPQLWAAMSSNQGRRSD